MGRGGEAAKQNEQQERNSGVQHGQVPDSENLECQAMDLNFISLSMESHERCFCFIMSTLWHDL